jgi:tetratricopeptide (TPR) repeat protein/pyruvate-formate lyase-activating enzyme
VPHQLTLTGATRGAALRRGALKANLIHHLAHAGGTAVLLRIGRAYASPRDWIPASGRPAQAALARAFDAAAAVETLALRRNDPSLRTLERFAANGEFWAHVGLALNLLRVWDGGEAFSQARRHADEIVRMEPGWAWGYAIRGEIRRSLIDYAGAIEDLQTAARLDAAWSWPPGFLSRALFQAGTDAAALKPLEDAIALAPEEGFLHCWRGEALRRLGRSEEAAAEFEAGLKLDPQYDQGYGWRARLLDAQGRHDEAAASLRRGITLCPGYEKARRQLGVAWRGAGTPAAAHNELDRATALNHRNNWIGVWRAEGHPPEAAGTRALVELDAYLLKRPRDARARLWRGETLVQIGRLPEGLAAIDAALKTRPRDGWALSWRGEALLKLGRVAEARQDLDRAVAAAPDYGRAWAWRGRARLLSGDPAGAEMDLTRALSVRRVEYAWIIAWRGEARALLGKTALAKSDLDAAVALDPGQGLFRLSRARVLVTLGDAQAARAELQAAQTRQGPVPEPLGPVKWGELAWRDILAAEDDRRAGRFGRALKRLSGLLPRHGGEASWLYLLRYRVKREAGLPGALRDVDSAFRGDPNAGWIAALAPFPEDGAPQARLLQKDWGDFLSKPACAALFAYQGQALLKRGETESGLAALERAAVLEDAAWILAWLGEGLRAAGRPAQARAALDRALAVDASYDNAWSWRATLKLAEGDARGAIEDLKRALRLRPTARAEHELSRALRAAGQIKGSLDALGRAVRLNADLGWGGPKAGAAASALKEIRDLRRSNADPRLAEWEGETLLRLRLFSQAAATLAGARTPWGRACRNEARLELEGLSTDLARDIRRGASRHRDCARAQALAAEAAFRGCELRRSASLASAASKLSPYSARLRVLKAKAFLASGRRADGGRELEKALRLAPEHKVAGRLLAQLREGAAPVVTNLLGDDGGAEEIKSLEYFVNYACNAKCPFCFNPPDASPELDRGLPLPTLARSLLEGWRKGYREVKFIGGEVTVRDDLPQILGLARRIGYRSIQLTTNGIRLADGAYTRRLVRLGVNRVRFSIHGHTSSLHDSLVAVPGALDKIKRAIAHLRPMGVELGVNYVLNRVNVAQFPETMEWLFSEMGLKDVIVYFIRYQGFGALAANKELLRLPFSEAAGPLREGFARLRGLGVKSRPQLIHFAPCVAPELAAHMLDWTVDPRGSGQGNTPEDLMTLPGGESGLIHDVTNKGKKRVAACAACALNERCLGIEQNYVAEFGEAEFRPVASPELAAA